MASKWLWFIFQLPEMSGLTHCGASLRSRACEAGEVAELEQLERGTATGGDVVDLVVEAELGERRGASRRHRRP